MKIKSTLLLLTAVSLVTTLIGEAATTKLNANGTWAINGDTTATSARILNIYGKINSEGWIESNGLIRANYFTAAGESEFNGVMIGKGSGNIATNTAIGWGVLDSLNPTGPYVTGVGSFALQYNSSGHQNTAIGHAALNLNTTGNNNTASGVGTLRNNTDGHNNTAIGVNSLVNNTTGVNNLSAGMDSLFHNVVGWDNTAVGVSALLKNTASSNTGVGQAAFHNNTVGHSNTAIGHHAGAWLRDGSSPLTTSYGSIYIGASCRGMSNADNNSIVLGTGAWGEGANTTVIGNGATVSTHLYGKTISDSLQVNGNTVINGNTVLSGTVVLAQAQGDISMGAYQ